MLRNRVYIAQVDVPDYGVSTRGDFEPIVSEKVFYRVQAILDGRLEITPTERPRFSAQGLRALRGVRQAVDGELVERAKRHCSK